MIKLLRKCGYSIGCEKGNINIKTNICDCILFTTYGIISFCNLLKSSPSNIIFFLNIISIGRLIIKNYISQCRIIAQYSHKSEYEGFSIELTKLYYGKTIGELVATVFFCITLICNIVDGTYKLIMSVIISIIILVTWTENFLNVLEILYDAKQVPMLRKKNVEELCSKIKESE